MTKSFRYQECRTRLRRHVRVRIILPSLLLIPFCIFIAIPRYPAAAQSGPSGTGTSSLCNRNSALELIRQQIDLAKTIDGAVHRVRVLIRSADLLWPFQQDKARTAFTEAFEVATQNEKEKRRVSQRPPSLIMAMAIQDQRYVVIRAIAKRDSSWAKRLTDQMLRQDRKDREESPAGDSRNDILTAQRLLDSATQLLPMDINASLELARASLNYPASFMITRFLYQLAEMNRQAADKFYNQALTTYAEKPMREFLYLSAYPFGFREGGDMPIFGFYELPSNFVTNESLQRQFVQILLRRAQQALEVPLDEGDNFNGTPGIGHILQVLMRIESQVRLHLPDLLDAVVQAREGILVSLSVETQKTFLQPDHPESSSPPKRFEELIETAKRTPNVNKRDELIISAVLSSSDKERLSAVVDAVDKITDPTIRAPILDWLYFTRAQSAINSKQLDEALLFGAKIEELELRAYLHSQIAKGLLGSIETEPRGRDLLNQAVAEANKAPATIVLARTLLIAASTFAKVDINRSISVLADAIACINKLEHQDLSNEDLVREIKGKGFTRRSHYYLPGLDAENAFREMARIDFDDTLSQSSAFADKALRSLTTLALADVCLQHSQLQRKSQRPQ